VKCATTAAARKRARTRAPHASENVPTGFPLPLETAPMEARSAEVLPSGDDWQYEPKWDGFRCLAFRAGDEVDLRAKSGKPLGRYFPEIVALLRGIAAAQFVVDGEIVIALDGHLSFDALQMRLHPAESRIRKLAAETPARLILFDMLAAPSGAVLTGEPLRWRRKALEAFMKTAAVPEKLVLSPFTRDRAEAERWLKAGTGGTDGVIAKQWHLCRGRARDGQGEAVAHGGLRRRRLSL
jgi:ATP-dependent DNA ligase